MFLLWMDAHNFGYITKFILKQEDIGGDEHPDNKDLTPPPLLNPILFLTLIIQRVPNNNKSLITNKP